MPAAQHRVSYAAKDTLVECGRKPGDKIIYLIGDILRTLTIEPFATLNSVLGEAVGAFPFASTTCHKMGSFPENILFPICSAHQL